MLSGLHSHAQIVNIEKERIRNQDSSRVLGKVSATAHIVQNKSLAIDIDLNPHIQFKHKRHIVLGIGHLEYTKFEKTAINSGAFIHLRYNYEISKNFKGEVFTQVQNNNIWNMPLRFLLGGGPRFKLINYKQNSLYCGPLYMFELQKVKAENRTQYNHRLSAYMSWNLFFGKIVFFSGTVYYQPLLSNFNNYRLSGLCELNFAISRRFTFDNRFGIIYDRTQTTDVPVQTYQFSSGLGYKF